MPVCIHQLKQSHRSTIGGKHLSLELTCKSWKKALVYFSAIAETVLLPRLAFAISLLSTSVRLQTWLTSKPKYISQRFKIS
jgi:hypothetical protein